MANATKDALDKFAQPKPISAVESAFGASNTNDLMPAYSEIPEEFRRGRTKWNKFQSDWFYAGLTSTDGLIAKDGIDKAVALRHLSAINGSFQPKHEHKEAGVAYLASRWFTDASTWTAAKKA